MHTGRGNIFHLFIFVGRENPFPFCAGDMPIYALQGAWGLSHSITHHRKVLMIYDRGDGAIFALAWLSKTYASLPLERQLGRLTL